MTRQGMLGLIGVVVVVLGAAAGGAWWYLYGPNEIASEELVPANTVAFASIPNAADLVTGYQTSQFKTVWENPNAKPLHDAIAALLGKQNVDLLHAFLPNLSGQSFIAVTHFDADHPEQIGLIAAMKPKAGLGDFGTFLDKLKAAYPDIIKQGKTGTGNVQGVDYDWIQGPGAPDKICVAHIRGWIVTSWGEASLADWIERFRKKSTTSSLKDDVDFRKSLERVGDNPMSLVYVNYHVLIDLFQKQMAKTHPGMGNYLAQKFDTLGGAALGTSFENGEIVDRFSFLIPRPDQLDLGMGTAPCPFETLKFTGPDTRFYWASSINWKQYYNNLKDQAKRPEGINPVAGQLLGFLQDWVKSEGLDVQHDIIDPLGPELSLQAEWPQNSTYPDVGFFVKLDNPDDFKPTIAAIIDSVHKAYANIAVIKELSLNGQNFAALKFVPPGIFSPTITENGPYFGVFLTEGQAVRSFSRDDSIALPHNADFSRQIGDKRQGAAQILFLDSPYLLNRSYGMVRPYLSFAQLFSKDLAKWLSDHPLPDDLTWLAPVGTWSCVVTPDEAGVQAYSVSGFGNQGIYLTAALGCAVPTLQSMGYLPKPHPEVAPVGPQQFGPASPTTPQVPKSTWTTPPPSPATNAVPPVDPNANPSPMPAANPATNGAPAAPPPAPVTNSNADATPANPAPAPPH
jgi:Protein of unknown function (DUF3352)